MSVYGEWKNAVIPAGSSITSAIDLAREYDYLSVIIPGMDACKLQLQVAETLGGTYYDLGNASTDEEAFNRADVWRLGGYRYIKIKASKVQDNAVAIRCCGMRY